MDPWTEPLFGQGQSGYDFKAKGIKSDISNRPINGVQGGVIMDKLGNETAKYVWHFIFEGFISVFFTLELFWDSRRGNYCKLLGFFLFLLN